MKKDLCAFTYKHVQGAVPLPVSLGRGGVIMQTQLLS